MPVSQAQSPKPRYSNVWRPITVQGIREGIRLNRTNGVGLEQIMARSLLQQKSLDYLSAIKAASEAEPKNAALLAAYAWGLARVKNDYTFTSRPAPMPERLSSRFDFSWLGIRDKIQRAKELDKRCWLAYIAESTLEPGGPPPTKEAAASKKAFEIQRNALTLTKYDGDLMFQSAGARDIEGIKRGQKLLLMAERLYPTYYRIGYEVAMSYTSPVEGVGSKEKSQSALRRFYNNIPPEYRKSAWVIRYLKHLELDKALREIGVTI